MNKASDDNGKIIFDGIALDARFKGLLDDLAQKGITTREALRNTALTGFMRSRTYTSAYEEAAFLRDLRVLTAEPATQPAGKTVWDDAIGKKIPVSSLFPDRAVIASLSQAGIETLYDLFRNPGKAFKQSPARAEECYEAFQTVKSLSIRSLGLINTGANILLRNGITSIGQLILTGDEYLSLLPGMQPNLMNDIQYALKNLRGVLVHYRKISGWEPKVPVKPDTPDQPMGTPPVKKEAAPSEANYRAFLSGQGNLYADDYVKMLRDLESPGANLGIGKRRLFSESVPESRETLDYLRKSLPGTKWNTDKARSILNNFDEFLKTLSEDKPKPQGPAGSGMTITDNEMEKTIRTALEELYKNHPKGVTASEISHRINDWKNLPPAKISEILDHAAWARKEWDPEIDNYRYTIAISEKTSGPEAEPDLAELVRNMLIKCSGKNHRYNTAAYIATSISDKTSVSRVKNILQNAEWAHENEYGLFTNISPEMIEAVRQTLRKQAIEHPYDVFIEQFAPMVHEKLTASQINSILMKSDWARKNPDSSFTYVPQTDEEKAAFYFEQYRTFLQIKTNEYDPNLYLKALCTLTAQININFPDVLKEDIDKNYEIAEYLKQNISKLTLQLHQERCRTAIDAFIDFLNFRKSGAEPEPTPETIEQIRQALENLCSKFPYSVFANRITTKISGVTSHSQIIAVLDKAEWAKKNDDGSYTYVQPAFVINEDTINIIKSVLQKLTKQFPSGVSVSMIVQEIKGNPTPEQIRQVLEKAEWAKEVGSDTYLYDPDRPIDQPNWTDYEAAILLDACLTVREHPELRDSCIKQVSGQLRQMAINQGKEISDIYRNIAGIRAQLYNMEAALRRKDASRTGHGSKIFSQIVRLYLTNKYDFDRLLQDAKDMCQIPATRELLTNDGFRNYLKNKDVSINDSNCYCTYLNIEKRVNLIELAPKGTGKSYVFEKISKRGWLISGGTVSRASLIYDNAKKTGGLLTRFDFVGFDEVQSITFSDPGQIQQALKHYMEYGEIKGFDAQTPASAGVIILGNIDAERFDINKNMVEHISSVFGESATLDRFHGFIPGWELPRMNSSLIANGWAINTEYFAEVMHSLRDDLIQDSIVDDCLVIPKGSDQRDLTAIKRLCTAFVKLLYPHAREKSDIPSEEFIQYCLEPAREMRAVIKKQLCIIDPKEFDVPEKRNIPDIQYKW